MVETAGKTKKNYNKIGTEDDPVIIAQRFLNIFRQLHIFTDERKQAFNQMILEQPAEIRGMFSSLPGGAVLQQYVDELEEKNGEDLYIIGGESLFRMFEDEVDELYRTVIHDTFEGDAYFPKDFDYEPFERVKSEKGPVDDKNIYEHTYELWRRK